MLQGVSAHLAPGEATRPVWLKRLRQNTTLLKCIVGLLPAKKGEGEVFGQELAGLEPPVVGIADSLGAPRTQGQFTLYGGGDVR